MLSKQKSLKKIDIDIYSFDDMEITIIVTVNCLVYENLLGLCQHQSGKGPQSVGI